MWECHKEFFIKKITLKKKFFSFFWKTSFSQGKPRFYYDRYDMAGEWQQRGCPLRAVLPLERFQGPKRWMCSTKLLMMIYYVKTQNFEKRIFFRTASQPGLGRPGLKRLKRPIYLMLINGFSKFLFSMKTIMNYEFFLTEILFFVQK